MGARSNALAALSFVSLSLLAPDARAQLARFETAHTVYHESPTRTNMTVYTPGASIAVSPTEWLGIRGGYEADVVSGATVAVKAGSAYQATNPGADVITTASVRDLRHSPTAQVTLKKGDTSYAFAYTYSTENDYRSHNLYVAARTDAYEHNTQFELSYARNWDGVCDRIQGVNDRPPRFRALEDSSGCFTGDAINRTRRSLGIDGFQATWSQAWTPTFVTQLVYTAQILDGFQSNPYRAVILGQGLKAQEHHPDDRARQSIALRGNLFVRPIKTAFRLGGRVYRDTWDIVSGTVDAEAERYFFEGFRGAVRARYYRQGGAVFWSDDYTGGAPPLGPKGQYWTGDRELSPFWSMLLGFRATYALEPAKKIGGFISAVKASVSGDTIAFDYSEFTLGGVPITNARAFIVGAQFGMAF